MQNNEQAQNQLNIELTEEMAEGIYSNLVLKINQSFLLNFLFVDK